MPTELEELVEFLHSDNAQVKQIALEHCVQFSSGPQQQLFAYDNYTAIKDLKALIQVNGRTTATQAATIMANLCEDTVMRDLMVDDEEFLKWLVFEVCNPLNKVADLMCILLTNLAKSDSITKVFGFETEQIKNDDFRVFRSNKAMDCLMDCFVKGADKTMNKWANYDYLSYFFADISRFAQGRAYFVTEQAYDEVVPISKLLVFTEKYDAKIRREGVASTIKNSLFDTSAHMTLITDEKINLLPYILLPLAGPGELDDEDMFNLPDELQLLPEDKKCEPVHEILCVHLESLLLLCNTRPVREYLREKSVYPLIKELHKAFDVELICELCDRLVQLLMRDEGFDDEATEDSDEDDQIVEVL
ncbi:hypothetical protein BABINDRAFT_12803 [Babjeviella inositovora NRRL Y-12698]|uniref:Protein HGH1 homolog n=1 Tax=Babjeviella inositovora NRRL Y-12698 TaxID=984486 RepID=A0A1E3QUJ9_9ASCO|nr:uncharacterized protein BABINDRAFT_12803 [Babjeviella inositovora NRRL Y-12698]ODQ80672.1 hypothetical protein BABINDRAFT_12803 [Babjeviella inositovora NRRL Y-12698]